MDAPPGGEPRSFEARVGLCSLCVHSRRILSGRGSTFWFCERSKAEPAYRKYPPLPVRACAGFEPVRAEERDGP